MTEAETEERREHVQPTSPGSRRSRWFLPGLGALAVLGGFVATAVLVGVVERRQEAREPFFRVVELDDSMTDPEPWGQNFPLQYDSYLRTVDQVRTRYGGSEALPRTPTEADPRSVVSQSKLAEDPRLVRMWAGYAFSRDFREERGHAYMLEDQTFTERQLAVQQPGACVNCHASTYTAMLELGEGDLEAGFERLNPLPYAEARELVNHPIACIDCHAPDTMALRITRPAFTRGIAKAKAAEGIDDYDVATMATRQEMRTFVCAQCHVEYYFEGESKELVYPWDRGLAADEILASLDDAGHTDWVHAETGASVLKAQHPEFELWSRGIHAANGVSCADCHMPYVRVGATKVSDHHVRSPLLGVNNACQTCHRVPEEELIARVETIQGRHLELRDRSMDALIDLIDGLVVARDSGATDAQLEDAREFQRKAQFLLDFAEAENSAGFHAAQEAARVLGLSIDYSRQGWMALPVSP